MKQALYKSIALHLVVLILFMIDVPAFWRHDMVVDQVPIIVDLNDVKISEMTNLPPKAKMGEEEREASKIKRKIEDNYTKETPPEPQEEVKEEKTSKEEPEAVDEKPQEVKQDYLVAPQPKKPTKPVQKAAPMPQPKKPQPKKPEIKKPQKPEKGTPQLANPLKSLLASVDALEKDIGETDQEAVIKEGTKVNNMGVEGGVGGSYFSELSITEADMIAGRLRQCWNLDPGAMGIEDMIVEIRTYLNQDASIRKVEILDMSRVNSDTHYRSVAESARRAVYSCAGVYKIFAEKYADKYDMWKTMLLRFNPMTGAVN